MNTYRQHFILLTCLFSVAVITLIHISGIHVGGWFLALASYMRDFCWALIDHQWKVALRAGNWHMVEVSNGGFRAYSSKWRFRLTTTKTGISEGRVLCQTFMYTCEPFRPKMCYGACRLRFTCHLARNYHKHPALCMDEAGEFYCNYFKVQLCCLASQWSL